MPDGPEKRPEAIPAFALLHHLPAAIYQPQPQPRYIEGAP